MKSGLRYALAGTLGGALIDALLATVRWDITNQDCYRRHTERGQPVIFVLWHGRLLPLGYVHRGQGVAGLASRSADGEYIARLLQHWGMPMIRGSSSSGGDAAFREMVRTIRGGRSLAITPDGPRGPRERIKPGVIQLAQMTGAPLVPIAGAATRGWWFESWDRFLVPQPFARVCVDYDEPLAVPRVATPEEREMIRVELEQRLHALMRRVEQRVRA